MSYDRLAPTISSKAKKNCLIPVTWVKIIEGGGARPPLPLSDGLDTRPCKILDPRLCMHISVRLTAVEVCYSRLSCRRRVSRCSCYLTETRRCNAVFSFRRRSPPTTATYARGPTVHSLSVSRSRCTNALRCKLKPPIPLSSL